MGDKDRHKSKIKKSTITVGTFLHGEMTTMGARLWSPWGQCSLFVMTSSLTCSWISYRIMPEED